MPLFNPNNPLNRPIALSNLFWIILVLILLAGNVFLGYKYSVLQGEMEEAKAGLKIQKIREDTLDFAKLFIEKVLKAQKEVDFETRLKLENAVRNLNDEEILANWQKFIGSKTEAEAQENVKDLLEMLIKKIDLR